MVTAKENKINLGFWSRLKKPFFLLAPMADVTDLAFRQMFVRHGKPDAMFTEFVSVDGLCSPGRRNLLRELRFLENERPIIAQIWGNKPENFHRAALLVKKLKFDGIDINMGCPQKKEIAHGSCGALINQPELARKIIFETKRGAGRLPVSVKTRIGFKEIQTVKWLKALLQAEPAAVTVHGRTIAEMSRVPAHWDEISRAVQLRNRLKSKSLIIGNGDVRSLGEGLELVKKYGVDGVMVGRGAFGNPWFFNARRPVEQIATEEKLEAMLEHARLFEKYFRGQKNFAVMRKHFKAYACGFPGARELRTELMVAPDHSRVRTIVEDFLRNNLN